MTGTCEEVLGGLLQLPIPQGCVLHRVSRTEDIEGCVRFCWLISELIFEKEILPEQHKNGSLVSVDKQKGRLIFMVLILRGFPILLRMVRIHVAPLFQKKFRRLVQNPS